MARKSAESSYTKKMQRLADRFLKTNNGDPATASEIAEWLIRNKLWEPQPSSITRLCAEELSKAMREEYFTDPQNRRVRAKHAARMKVGKEQLTFWADIRTASHEHLLNAFKQRRQQIVSDCWQLKVDVDSYNENRAPVEPIQIPFDFTPDLEEKAFIVQNGEA
jgi:hypothetical protein